VEASGITFAPTYCTPTASTNAELSPPAEFSPLKPRLYVPAFNEGVSTVYCVYDDELAGVMLAPP